MLYNDLIETQTTGNNMKIKPNHLEHIKTACLQVIADYPNLINEYENGDFPRADKVKVLQERFNHDVLFGAGLTQFVCGTLYAYMNDENLASALRSFMPVVIRKY